MKKIILILVVGFIGFAGININVYANENTDHLKLMDALEEVPKMFEDFQPSDKVLITPEGGILNGEMTVFEYDNPDNIIAEYSSSSDQSISIDDAKEYVEQQIKEEFSNNTSTLPSMAARSAAVPTGGRGIQGTYTSNQFSGSGWRFGGLYFVNYCNKTVSGYVAPGGPLYWKTFVDDGRVGDRGDIEALTIRQILLGVPIYRNHDWQIVREGSGYQAQGLAYFTYNPIPGTFYQVDARPGW